MLHQHHLYYIIMSHYLTSNNLHQFGYLFDIYIYMQTTRVNASSGDIFVA